MFKQQVRFYSFLPVLCLCIYFLVMPKRKRRLSRYHRRSKSAPPILISHSQTWPYSKRKKWTSEQMAAAITSVKEEGRVSHALSSTMYYRPLYSQVNKSKPYILSMQILHNNITSWNSKNCSYRLSPNGRRTS